MFDSRFGLWIQLLTVAAGGALGACIRFGLAQWSQTVLGTKFPWGTLLANLSGCFLMGCLYTVLQKDINPFWRLALGVGFLGALTTFSTFGLDVLELWRAGRNTAATIYLMASVAGGVGLLFLGNHVGEIFWPLK